MENTLNKPKREFGPLVSYVLFVLIQATVLFVFFVPFSWELVAIAVFSYYLRIFGITGAYHRYFSHNAYKTSRVFQFMLGWLGAMAMQKGPIWWAAHHRNHHKHSDTEKDLHSPREGFWHSHMLWFLKPDHNHYETKIIKDFLKYPELRFIDRFYWLPPLVYAFQLYYFGLWLGGGSDHLYAFSVLVYGYAVATFFVGHGTWTINSLSHVIGKV
ncbi:MAG: fatty acid desaturase, partial [Spirochaetota bacterium]